MTKLEQLRDAIFPLISEKQHNEELIYHLIASFCPADKMSCSDETVESCWKCWNRGVAENEGQQ